jgi:Putative T7SS secretion signal domain
MAAELGHTDDPNALIPGNVESVHNTAWSMTVYGDVLHNAGTGLQRINTTGGWSGEAADHFRDVFHSQPGKWLEAGNCFHDAAQALDTYASTLMWAQQEACEAIRLWNEGQAATEAAQIEHVRAVQQAQQQAAAQTVGGTPTVAPEIHFVDTGESKRAAARSTLDRARGQLRNAGDTAAGAVGKARDNAPPEPSLWQRAGDFMGGVGDGLVDTGKHAVNGLASFGNAAIHHPQDVLAAAGGIALTAVSATSEVAGVALDATGVGAVVGGPLNVVSATGMATGLAITGVAMADIASHAAGEDHVSPLNTEDDTGPGAGSSEAGNPPKEISGRTNHGDQQAQSRDAGHGVSDSAMEDAVKNSTSPPEAQANGTFKYVGKDAVVVLNQEGKVVTTWARNSNGWRKL